MEKRGGDTRKPRVMETLAVAVAVAGALSVLASVVDQLYLAALLILLALTLDRIDRNNARDFGDTFLFGHDFTSLARFVAFAVAPAAIVCVLVTTPIAFIAAALFVFAALLGLGRLSPKGKPLHLFGTPLAIIALFLAVMVLLGFPVAWFPWYLLAVTILAGTVPAPKTS